MANRDLFMVMDENGRFLGESQAYSKFAVTLPPGEHMFVSWSESAEALKATLLPGRTYYVEVSPRIGAFTARVDLLAVAPRLGSWQNLQDWLSNTETLEPDVAQGQAQLASDPKDVQENLSLAKKNFAELDKEEVMERTLLPEDGVPSAGAPAATPPGAAAPPLTAAGTSPPAGVPPAAPPAAAQ
jgi:hypothetical protein